MRKNSKKLVAVCGLPGSGKSYFASRLASHLKAVYLNSDRLRRQLLNGRRYTEREKMQIYDNLLARAKSALRRKRNVVVDATFYKSRIRRRFSAAIKYKEDFVIIEVRAAQRVARARLSKPRKYSDADFDVYKRIKMQWEPISQKHLVLTSTDANISDMIRKTLSYLQKNDVSSNR